MSLAEQNRQLVRHFYDLMSQQRFDEMFELMTDDATWTVAGNPQTFPHAGTATKPQREAALRNFTKVFASLDMDLRSLTAEDDRVAVEAITRCQTLKGLQYVNELLIVIRCRGGKIARLYEHLDQQTALEFDDKLKASLAASA